MYNLQQFMPLEMSNARKSTLQHIGGHFSKQYDCCGIPQYQLKISLHPSNDISRLSLVGWSGSHHHARIT